MRYSTYTCRRAQARARPRPTVPLLLLLTLLAITKAAWGRSECQIWMEGEGEGLSPAGTIHCTGDEVRVAWPWFLTTTSDDTGTAIIEKNYDYSITDQIIISDAEDVTFTEVIIRNTKTLDGYTFVFTNCQRCTFQNVLVDSLSFYSDNSGVPFCFKNSIVTIEHSVFKNMGWNHIYGSAGIIDAIESDITLRNVSIQNVTLLNVIESMSSSTVSIKGGKLMAEDSSWNGISVYANSGRLLAVSNGGEMILKGCTITDVQYRSEDGTVSDANLMPIDVGNNSTAVLMDSSLVRLKVTGGGTAILRNVTFPNLQQPNKRPMMQFIDSSGAVLDTVFSSISGTNEYELPAVILDVVHSEVNVTGCTFDNISWFKASDASLSIEGRVVRATDGSSLRISNSTFNAVGGSGTAVGATLSSSLEMVRVKITNIDISQTIGERRAAVVVTSSSSFYAKDTIWNSINMGNSSSGAALHIDGASSASLYGCNFTDIKATDSSAAQFFKLTGRINIVGCVWSNIITMGVLRVIELQDDSLVTITGTQIKHAKSASWGTILFHCLGTAKVTLSNLTVTNNTAELGGALVVLQCTVSITNSVFRDNTAWAADGTGGGAIYVQERSDLTITSSQFLSNRAVASGGALFARSQNNLTCIGCTFKSNSAGKEQGGALAFEEGSSAVIVNSTFLMNKAGDRGGAIHVNSGTLSLGGCTFTSNSAVFGGAVSVFNSSLSTNNLHSSLTREVGYFPSGDVASGTSPANETTMFMKNEVNETGGAIFADSSSLSLGRCIFIMNTARRFGGAIAVLNSRVSTPMGSMFTSNKASSGGAIVSIYSSSNLTESTFLANSADGYGGVMISKSGTLTLRASILAGNTAIHGGALCLDCNLKGDDSMESSALQHLVSNSAGNATVDRERILRRLENIFNTSSTSTTTFILESIFMQNGCTASAYDVGSGGAVHVNGHVLIRSSSFINNSCQIGGAVVFGLRKPNEWVAVVQSNFRSNKASIRGGAISLLSSQIAMYGLIFGNSFEANSATGFGGAVDVRAGWSMDLVDNSFKGNGNPKATIKGSALYLTGCRNLKTDPRGAPEVYMLRNNFSKNTGSSGGGSAVFSQNCDVMYI